MLDVISSHLKRKVFKTQPSPPWRHDFLRPLSACCLPKCPSDVIAVTSSSSSSRDGCGRVSAAGGGGWSAAESRSRAVYCSPSPVEPQPHSCHSRPTQRYILDVSRSKYSRPFVSCVHSWGTNCKVQQSQTDDTGYKIRLKTRNVGTPQGRPAWWTPPPSRWWFQRVGEHSGPIFSRQSTKVHEILGQCRGLLVVFKAVSHLSKSFSCQRYWHSELPLSCEVVENRSAVFRPPFFAGWKTLNILRLFVIVVYPL